ncbi:hypothetical protein GW17_00040673 [Ensete ventricosum]|nr:hypothetical protein GW17_00040673 [Ensete ventricosum]
MQAGVGFLGSAAGPWRSDARSLDSTSYGRPADADVSLPRIRCRRALEVSFGPRPAQQDAESVEGVETGVRGRHAEPPHVGIVALHSEALSEEEAPRFGGVREEGVQNRQPLAFRFEACSDTPPSRISSIFPSLFVVGGRFRSCTSCSRTAQDYNRYIC